MFDAMSLNDRILRSKFDQAVNSMVCAASGAGRFDQGMEVSAVSHAPKILCCHKMRKTMEIMSNIERKSFALNVRRDGSQPSIFVRTLSAITSSPSEDVSLMKGG